ncbi:MAG TPA: hypothetical protein VNI34_06710 [Candidatus Nitrosotalea sp.]|nr:hypothetical protein [Candidatus Nitrosotalea sp.]
MSLSAQLAATLALLVFPGGLLALAVGALAEVLASRLGLAAAAPGGRAWVAPAIAISLLASAQLAMPLSPLSPLDSDLGVALVALALVGWLAWADLGGAASARRLLIYQGLWSLAVLAPGIPAQNLRPQVVAVLLVPGATEVKVLAGVLYVLCLPGLLGLSARAPMARPIRTLLWFPYCGLFVSEFIFPGSGDAAGAARFIALSLLLALFVLALAGLWRRHPLRWPNNS